MSQSEAEGGWRTRLSALGGDVHESLRLRIDLGQLEAKAAAADVRRLTVGMAVAGVLATVGLATAAVGAADAMEGIAGLTKAGWLAIFSAVIMATGAVVGTVAWLRFRREFVGFEETLEELREDARWLGEILGAKDPAGSDQDAAGRSAG